MEDMLITMGLAVLLKLVKNPEHAASFKAALLKLRNAINTLFPGD